MGTHSPHEVGEEREAAMVGHMRNGIYEDAEYFSHNVFDCGRGCGLLWRQWVWLLVRGAAVTMGSCESGEYGGARLCACIHVHVLMRDEKERRKKQARSNKQQGKTTHVYMYTCI